LIKDTTTKVKGTRGTRGTKNKIRKLDLLAHLLLHPLPKKASPASPALF